MHKKLLVTGSEGQLAKSFLKLFSNNYKIFYYDKKTLDISNYDQVIKILNEIQLKLESVQKTLRYNRTLISSLNETPIEHTLKDYSHIFDRKTRPFVLLLAKFEWF